jgi:2-methylcitrate dehydratase
LTVTLEDGTVLEEEVVEAPLGHRLRRDEARPIVMKKYETHTKPHVSAEQWKELDRLSTSPSDLDSMDVDKYVDLYWQGSK